MKTILTHLGVRVTADNSNPANTVPITVKIQPGAARQAAPSTAPMRRRQDRAIPETTEPTHHEKLRFAVCHRAHGWLHEYRDGDPTWGGPQEAALFSDDRAARAVACELGGEIVNVFCKVAEGGA